MLESRRLISHAPQDDAPSIAWIESLLAPRTKAGIVDVLERKVRGGRRTCESGSTPGLTGDATDGLGAGEAPTLAEASSGFSLSPETDKMESLRPSFAGDFLGLTTVAADAGVGGVSVVAVVGVASARDEVEFLLPIVHDEAVSAVIVRHVPLE